MGHPNHWNPGFGYFLAAWVAKRDMLVIGYALEHSPWTLAFPFFPSVFHRAWSSWIIAWKWPEKKMHVLSSAALTVSSSPGSLAALSLPASADGFTLSPSPSYHKNILQPQTGREKWAAATWPRGAVPPPDGVKHSLPFPFLWMYSRSRDCGEWLEVIKRWDCTAWVLLFPHLKLKSGLWL